MKKNIDMILGISFLILLGSIIWINYLMKNNVGDINFDAKIDDSSFKTCNEDRIFQYYSVGTSFKGERKAIRESIFKDLESSGVNFGNKSGYITFRFIVNCNGESGRYRFKQVDESFLKTTFGVSEVKKLKNAVIRLKNWNAGTLKDGTPVDSYYQINFKIIEGEIEDIF